MNKLITVSYTHLVISEDEKAYACYQDTYEIEKGRARQSAALRPWFCFEYFIKKGDVYKRQAIDNALQRIRGKAEKLLAR